MRTKNGATPPSRVADAFLTYIREHSAGNVAVAHSVLAVTRSPEEIAAADSLLELSRSATPESRYFSHNGPSNTSVVSPLIAMGRISKSYIPGASKAKWAPKASKEALMTEYRAQRPKRKARPPIWAPKQVEGGHGEDDMDEEFDMVSSEDEFSPYEGATTRNKRRKTSCRSPVNRSAARRISVFKDSPQSPLTEASNLDDVEEVTRTPTRPILAPKSRNSRVLRKGRVETESGSVQDAEAESTISTSGVQNSKQSHRKGYSGKWAITITGPKKDDKEALKPAVAKNSSSRPEDKLWNCDHHPTPMIRTKAKKCGKDVDDDAATVDMLTLRLSLKSDPDTKMEIKYDAPADWDDQDEITSLIKVITQHRRREAGVKMETRHAYSADEVKFLAKYFEDNVHLQGANAMSKNARWQVLTADFNARFKGRTARIASRGGDSVEIGERSWHAIMAECDRAGEILKARKMPTVKTTPKRKMLDDGHEGVAGGEQDRNME